MLLGFKLDLNLIMDHIELDLDYAKSNGFDSPYTPSLMLNTPSATHNVKSSKKTI